MSVYFVLLTTSLHRFEVEYGCSLTSASNACPSLTEAQRRDAFVQSPYVVSIYKAVLAFAQAIREVCGNSGLCPALTNMGQEAFYQTLLALDHTVVGTSIDGERIAFNDHGDPADGAFDVFIYKDTGSGVYGFEKVRINQNCFIIVSPL